MRSLAPHWLAGLQLRQISFEPTFHKHVGKLCHGVHIHAEGPAYDHAASALAAPGARLQGDPPPPSRLRLWRDFPYEYEFGKLAIDVINGGPALREWVDDPASTPDDLDALTTPDEQAWEAERRPYLLY
jgi:hypothetical protein